MSGIAQPRSRDSGGKRLSARKKVEIARLIERDWLHQEVPNFSETKLPTTDCGDVLCCHPVILPEAQVALALNQRSAALE